MRQQKNYLVLLFIFILFFSWPAWAALPAELDGKPLPSLAPVLDKTLPSVVNIYSQTRVRVRSGLLDDPFFRHFFDLPSMPRERVSQSLGSGVIVDSAEGIIVTNNHVIAGADDVWVNLADGRTFKAEVMGLDEETDLAVIKIEADKLAAIALAPADQLRVGDFVVAVGNPFGLGQTVTSGIVSALGRSGVRGLGFQRFIQTDASINPGNSGGALINLRGELVGINTAIYSPSGGNVGIGFAIPVNIVKSIQSQLLSAGRVLRGTLGVDVADLDSDLAQAMGVSRNKGAVINQVDPASPAEAAGLQPGDVIVNLGGVNVESASLFRSQEALAPVGEKFTIGVIRNGKTHVLWARIDDESLDELSPGEIEERLDGMLLKQYRSQSEQGNGHSIVVEKMLRRSTLYALGLRPGDQLRRVNGMTIRDLDQLRRLLKSGLNELTLEIVRGGRLYRLEL